MSLKSKLIKIIIGLTLLTTSRPRIFNIVNIDCLRSEVINTHEHIYHVIIVTAAT